MFVGPKRSAELLQVEGGERAGRATPGQQAFGRGLPTDNGSSVTLKGFGQLAKPNYVQWRTSRRSRALTSAPLFLVK